MTNTGTLICLEALSNLDAAVNEEGSLAPEPDNDTMYPLRRICPSVSDLLEESIRLQPLVRAKLPECFKQAERPAEHSTTEVERCTLVEICMHAC